ncbi:MAG TPA: hypothetical protein VFA68_14335 [Terriglobales bacterium]|nr:hypothetical protein [Terriglobales bacterium]
MPAPDSVASSVVVLGSTFYTAALEKPFADVLARADRPCSVLCVPYNQLHTFLLDPGSLVAAAQPAQVILLVRVEDLIRLELMALAKSGAFDRETYVRIFRERTEQLIDVLDRISRMRLILLICPSGRGAHSVDFLDNYIRVAEHKIAATIRSQQRHIVLSWPDFEKMAPSNPFNVAGDRLGHVPFTPEGLEALTAFLVAQLDRLPATRVISRDSPGSGLDLQKFLGALQLEIAAAPMNGLDEQPTLDLVRHTTHFINLPDRKWTRENLRLLGDGNAATETWVLRVRDRFGDYGISGAISLAVHSEVMHTGLLFLTCPVLGKQVEHAFLRWIADLARQRHAKLISVPYVKGRDNDVLYNFLAKFSDDHSLHGNSASFQIPLPGLASRILKEAPNPSAVSSIGTKAQAAA